MHSGNPTLRSTSVYDRVFQDKFFGLLVAA
jgi:hypothetical protein